jgi:ankyrin repeat protein
VAHHLERVKEWTMDFLQAVDAGDEPAVRAMLDADPSLRDQHADLVPRLAEARSWSALRLLLELGFEVSGPTSDGATPLHHAAAAGELETARLLVQNGADLDAREPQFNARPAGWAQYFKKRETQEYLESLA